jgi:hypothetical protein
LQLWKRSLEVRKGQAVASRKLTATAIAKGELWLQNEGPELAVQGKPGPEELKQPSRKYRNLGA